MPCVGNVQDGQTPVSEDDPAVGRTPQSLVVGTAMDQTRRHGLDGMLVDRPSRDDPRDAAHFERMPPMMSVFMYPMAARRETVNFPLILREMTPTMRLEKRSGNA